MLVSSAKVNGVIVPIIAFSAAARPSPGDPRSSTGVRLCRHVVDRANRRYMVILLMIGILIAAGCVMETTPNIVILAPILEAACR